MVNGLTTMQQPSRQTRLDRVQRIAGRNVLELRHQRPGVGLNSAVQGAAVAERALKSRRRNLQGAARYPHNGRHWKTRWPQCREQAHGSLVADNRGRDRLAVGHAHDEGDQTAQGKMDALDYVTRPHQHGISFEPYRSEMRHKEFEVCGRQRS